MTLVGKRVRQFRIEESLGEGGMGDVYLGMDEKLNRRVALKVLRHEHRLRPAAKARLLREARILSQLDHPHICRIYDFVEEDDAEFLVLELIEGKSLRQLFKEGIDERQAMKIALEVAGVLVAAHSRGVVHRDLKPDNVMITPEGSVKVLDFGIARSLKESVAADGSELRPESADEVRVPAEAAVEEDPSEAPTVTIGETDVGTVTGTVAYMSPEQARSESVSAASDMYSFGLLLQELFTGQSPYPKDISPAVLLLKASRGETQPVIGVDPDLTALIERLKSLEPAARPAALDAAERLEGIADKPRRRRLRNLKIAAVVFLAVIAAVMTVMTIKIAQARDRANREYLRANQEAERANQEAHRASLEADAAREVSNFLVDLFQVSNPSEARGNTITAREILDRGAEKINQQLAGQPETQARLMHVISTVFRRLGLYDDAEQLARRSLAIREETLEPDHPDVALSLVQLACLLRFRYQLPEAEELFDRALAIQQEVLDPNDPALATTLTELGMLYWYQQRLTDAERVLEEAGKIWKLAGPDTVEEARSLDHLAWVYLREERHSEAGPRFRRALAIRERDLGPDHPDVAFSLHGLGLAEHSQGRYQEAELAYQRSLEIRLAVLGEEHGFVGWTLNSLGQLYHDLARYGDAEAAFQQALTCNLGPPNRSISLVGLGDVRAARALYREAEQYYRQALDVLGGQVVLGYNDKGVYHLAEVLALQHRFEEGEQHLQQVEEAWGGPDSISDPAFLNTWGDLCRDRGRFAQAGALYSRAQEVAAQKLSATHPAVAQALAGLGALAAAEGRPAAAEDLYRRALRMAQQSLGPDHPQVALTLRRLGRLLFDQERFDEAEPLLERALAIRSELFRSSHPLVTESRNDLDQLRRVLPAADPEAG